MQSHPSPDIHSQNNSQIKRDGRIDGMNLADLILPDFKRFFTGIIKYCGFGQNYLFRVG